MAKKNRRPTQASRTPPNASEALGAANIPSVAEVEYGNGYSSIRRVDRQRVVTVSADVNRAATTPERVLQAMETIFKHVQRDMFRKFLRQSETKEAIIDLIHEADELA